MSDAYYAKLWIEARKDLQKLIELDKAFQEEMPIFDRPYATDSLIELYFRYRRIVHRFTECLDQLVQPQIRDIVGKMLDYSIVRMLEIRIELVNLTLLECPWSIDPLLKLKITPEDVDLSVPSYDSAARMVELERRRKLVEKAGDPPPPRKRKKKAESAGEAEVGSVMSGKSGASKMTSKSRKSTKSQKTEARSSVSTSVPVKESPEDIAAREAREAEEALAKEYNDRILLIQSHERARVVRRTFIRIQNIREIDRKVESGELVIKEPPQSVKNAAATVIQKCWRKFAARRRRNERKAAFEENLRITIPYWRSMDLFKRCEMDYMDKMSMQKTAAEKLEQAMEEEKRRIWEVRGPGLIEDIRIEIREWFLMWFNELGFFDWLPSKEDGGSTLVATSQVRTFEEYRVSQFSSGAPKPPPEKPKPTEDVDDFAPKVEDTDLGWEMQPSRILPLLDEANIEFMENWDLRSDIITKPNGGGFFIDLIRDKLCYKLQLEMRKLADDYMKEELHDLNQALLDDHAEDEYPFELPDRQNFDPEAEVKSKKPPQPQPEPEPEKDPLEHVPPDELLIELSRLKVLRECPGSRLSDWPGVPSYVVTRNPQARLGDIKLPVMDYCVLPFASKIVNALAPPIRSVCICGPPGCGQLYLAHAICNELKATVFNLTPEKHRGRFANKDSQRRLILTVLKLAKAFAPSVVLTESDKAWVKRVTPELRRIRPKRFAPIYNKILKGIEPGDQVLFLTVSTEPYLATRSFVKFHDKIIIIPVADYGTMYLSYKKTLMGHQSIDRHIDVHCLAKMMGGEIPLELAQNVLNKTLAINRRMEFKRKPFRQMNLLEELFNATDPMMLKDHENFQKFREKLPLEVIRLERMKLEEEQEPPKK